MANKTENNQDSDFNSLDLSQLKDLSFGPDWASESGKKKTSQSLKKFADAENRRGQRGSRSDGGQRRGSKDRRTGFTQKRDDDRKFGRSGRDFSPPFEPTVNVIFVSQDKPFEVLLKAIRTTYKTYQLFEIARIILGKENRFVAIVSPLEQDKEKKIFISVPDQLPFETRDEAVNHVLKNHIDRFFEISEIEVEPPKGNFQNINRCTLTGELLAPPNFHRYQEILKEHHSQNINNLSFEKFLEKVESVKDPEVVQEWIDKMKVIKQYTLKKSEGDESDDVKLTTLEDVKYYLLTERKNEIFSTKDKVRLNGEKVESLPMSNIRRSIERELENQRRFPLITSNHLRGRLRRCNLNFFKRGPKGITYVCAVKRKQRYKDTVFSPSIQELIEYIEKNAKITVEKLLSDYLPSGVKEVTDESKKTVIQDLRWLVETGYVSEYSDGTLSTEKALDINASDDKNQQPQKESKSSEPKAEKESPVAASTEPEAKKDEAQPTAETPAEEKPDVAETPEEVANPDPSAEESVPEDKKEAKPQ